MKTKEDIEPAVSLCEDNGVEFWALAPRGVWGVRSGRYVHVDASGVTDADSHGRQRRNEDGYGRAVYDNRYGVRHVGPVHRIDGSGWYRRDRYVSNDGETFTEGLHAAGRDDISDYQPGADYNPRCGWCYLGARHTKSAHETGLTA